MQTIKIKTADIAEFFKRSKSIKANAIMPILSYLKLEGTDEGATIAKSNLNAFCVHQVSEVQVNEPVLLDERLLNALLQNTSAPELEIGVHQKTISLKCGTATLSFPREDASLFPQCAAPAEAKEWTPLPGTVLESLGIAKNFVKVLSDNMETPLSFVYCYGGKVVATDSHVLYKKQFDFELPELMLYPDTCTVLAGFESIAHCTKGNYDYFDTGKTMYGFIMPEGRRPDFDRVMPKPDLSQYFEIQLSDMVAACQLAASVCTTKDVDGKIAPGMSGITFTSEIPDYDTPVVYDIPTEGPATCKQFGFNAKLMLSYLKALPYKTIRFVDGHPNNYSFYTSEDAGYTGLIMKVQ